MLEGGIDPNIANHQGDTLLTIMCASERDVLYSEADENILLGYCYCYWFNHDAEVFDKSVSIYPKYTYL